MSGHRTSESRPRNNQPSSSASSSSSSSFSSWNFSPPAPGRNVDSLTLAPINPNPSQPLDHPDDDDNNDDDDSNNFQLPPLDDSDFYEELLASQSPPPVRFSPSPSSFESRSLSPPSNQQASQQRNARPRRRSEYHIPDSDSDDLYDDLFGPESPPAAAEEEEDRVSRPPAPTSPSSLIDLTASSPEMAPTKKRKRDEVSGPSTAVQTKPKREASSKGTRSATPRASRDSVEVVDLEHVEGKDEYEDFRAKQQAEAITKQNEGEANKPIRLSEFNCSICLDNPTDLTVTHCGHLFCSECLHSALHIGEKKCCPVCRANITLTTNGKKSRTGIFYLEMKLMTANRKGKQVAK